MKLPLKDFHSTQAPVHPNAFEVHIVASLQNFMQCLPSMSNRPVSAIETVAALKTPPRKKRTENTEFIGSIRLWFI
jgi:hypothetical protein